MCQIESAHGPLRGIYRILTETYGELWENLKLRLNVKAMNDTTRSKCLVPSSLVFVTIKSLENTGDILMEQEDRFQEMHTARAEASKKIAEQRIREALRPNITPAAKYKLHTGQEAMDYREKRKK